MKDPAIHIKRSDLAKILSELGVSDKIIPELFTKAKQYSIRNRVFVSTKTRGKKKAERSLESDTNLLDQFNRIYQGVIVSNDIKALSIGKNSPQYITLKEVCHQAKEFSDLFELGYEVGFKTYVETGVKLLGHKFGIYRLKSYGEKVTEYYRDKLTIEGDKTPKLTDDMIVAWVTAVKVYFRTNIAIENDVQRVHFVRAKDQAELYNADYYDWIYAQFEKWSYLNSIPAFTQLYGDNAKVIYDLYMAKVKKSNSKEEQKYFNTISHEKTIPLKTTLQEEGARKARLQSRLQETRRGADGAVGAD